MPLKEHFNVTYGYSRNNRQYSFTLIIPEPGTRQPENIPVVQSLPKLFKRPNLKLFTLPVLPFPIKSVAYTYPSFIIQSPL